MGIPFAVNTCGRHNRDVGMSMSVDWRQFGEWTFGVAEQAFPGRLIAYHPFGRRVVKNLTNAWCNGPSPNDRRVPKLRSIIGVEALQQDLVQRRELWLVTVLHKLLLSSNLSDLLGLISIEDINVVRALSHILRLAKRQSLEPDQNLLLCVQERVR